MSLIHSPEFYASPENRLREVVIPFLPDWLPLRADSEEVDESEVEAALEAFEAVLPENMDSYIESLEAQLRCVDFE